MDAVRFEKSLGKPEDSPEVSKLLKDLGVTKKLKLSGDDSVRVRLPDLGVFLTFDRLEPKSSRLRLRSFELNAGGKHDVTGFTGKLMRGLEFKDTKVEARKKLGKPTNSVDVARLDHWDIDNTRLTVGYSKEGSIQSIILALLEDDDDE